MAKSDPGIKPLNNQPSTTSGHHSQHNCNIRKQFRPESEYYGESFEVPLNINFFWGGGNAPFTFFVENQRKGHVPKGHPKYQGPPVLHARSINSEIKHCQRHNGPRN